MRVTDRPTPPLILHSDPALDLMPLRPVIAISGLRKVAEWDDPDNVWDAEHVNAGTSARVGTARVGFAKVGNP
jgi:hypothetical protein